MREKRQLHLPLLFLAVLFGLFLSLGSQSRAYETKNLTLNGSYDGNETYMQVGDVIGTVAAPTKYYSVEGTNAYFKLTLDNVPVNPLGELQ